MNDDFKPYRPTGVFTAPKSGTYTVTGLSGTTTVKLPAGYTIDVKALGNATIKLKDSPMTKEERKTLNTFSKKKLIDRIAELKSGMQAYRDENSAKNQAIHDVEVKLNKANSENFNLRTKWSKAESEIQQLKNVIKSLSQCL